MYDKWNKLPKKSRANLDQMTTKLKFNKLLKLIELALKYEDPDRIQNVLRTIKKYRQHGLDMHGEFGPENLAFKALRSKGLIKKLYDKLNQLHSKQLSLPEAVEVEESDEVANRLFQEYTTYNVNENSGYIPSEKEKNDPRFKTALTVDVKPSSIKDNARKLGSKISRAGIPPLLRT
jgi:tyrosyl-tRNA synthetase